LRAQIDANCKLKIYERFPMINQFNIAIHLRAWDASGLLDGQTCSFCENRMRVTLYQILD
jgi:hypothetical protein